MHGECVPPASVKADREPRQGCGVCAGGAPAAEPTAYMEQLRGGGVLEASLSHVQTLTENPTVTR